ncbi:MAG: carbon starvation CstA family protein [Bdellovibrionota bacterium]
MSLSFLAAIVILALTGGYFFYGRLVARQYALDPDARVPSVEKNDGIDFVPTKPFYLFSQHFSAIAAAGPIVGPIAACLVFGWLPCLLWIVVGVIFIGSVHDFSALVASVRHGAFSIAEIAKENLGRRAWLSLIAFIWLALVYVITAFADVTASTFVGKTEELAGEFAFNPGGAVAAASTMYLLLALVMGLVQRKWNPSITLLTVIFVPATLGVVWLGTKISTVLLFDVETWRYWILGYCIVASLLPIWLLQQSRGYLGGFVLYLALAAGVIGIFFGGFEIQQPAFKAFSGPKFEELLFPFLFVTIACGACSGFHGLVCGGTTSKQIEKETHCEPVGYGAMLLEGFVAVIALATIMIVPPGELAGKGPGKIYGDGIAKFLTVILGKDAFVFAATFGAMAFSTFIFDTLDVATRLGRYLLQELSGKTGLVSGALATVVTAGSPLLLFSATGEGGWKKVWVLFGSSNQLLATLTLLVVTVWLYRNGKRYWYTLIPMLFVLGVTGTSLSLHVRAAFQEIAAKGFALSDVVINGAAALILLALAGVFVFEGARAVLLRREAQDIPAPTPSGAV